MVNFDRFTRSNGKFLLPRVALLLLLNFVLILLNYINISTTEVSGQTPYEVHILTGASNPTTATPYNPPVVPANPTQLLPRGSTITWINEDQTFHTVTSGDPLTGPDTRFDSGILSPGTRFSWMFGTPGTFSYFCTIHPFMRGEIRVGE